MKCFNDNAVNAIGVCKVCGNGLCGDCILSVEPGLVCASPAAWPRGRARERFRAAFQRRAAPAWSGPRKALLCVFQGSLPNMMVAIRSAILRDSGVLLPS